VILYDENMFPTNYEDAPPIDFAKALAEARVMKNYILADMLRDIATRRGMSVAYMKDGSVRVGHGSIKIDYFEVPEPKYLVFLSMAEVEKMTNVELGRIIKTNIGLGKKVFIENKFMAAALEKHKVLTRKI
jgi:hypothetical protein